MPKVLAIDPGSTVSAYIEWDGTNIYNKAIDPNEDVLVFIKKSDASILLVEQITCYGMVVGQSIFDTVFWSGRFAQAWEETGKDTMLIARPEIKNHHCGTVTANDSKIRSTLILKYGKLPIKSHLWSALAVATFYTENLEVQQRLVG